MNRFLKILFFALVVKPLVLIGLGLNIRGRKNLPTAGGSIVAANHNSHLDALVLMSLFKLSQIHRIRPVAAADYFTSNRYLSWFSRVCMGIIPLERTAARFKLEDFDVCHAALDAGDILIIFPEGFLFTPPADGAQHIPLHPTTATIEPTPIMRAPVLTPGASPA